ncbi:cytochrome C oxidase subunit IV family protein [Streptomyces fuscichromogenes]|uniref:cytochrome C oxidase subunit IV family protein n=1 Tax=Streptomyces fuscichromogenes TaxID=1324013 RepID=UPI001E2BEFC8|nr:cytochrome C oxidase subunit IV family protein [Streptomyces fuscichromogenes]
MNTLVKKRLLIAWLALSLMTLGYLAMDHSADRAGALRPSVAVTIGAVLIAAAKMRIIFREFMEVRHAPAWLGRLTDLCVLLLVASLLGSYFIGRAAG